MRNEVEQATAELFLARGWNAKENRRKDIQFADIFDYLPTQHKRWKHIKEYPIKTREQPCIRSLVGVFNRLVSKPKRL